MDVSKPTEYRHFNREECYHYLANFPQRPESGRYRQVNVLVISEVTARSVSMKLRQAYVLRGRQQQLRNAKDLKAGENNRVSKHGSFNKNAGSFNKNAGSSSSGISSVVLSDSDLSQSEENVIDLTVVNEIEDHGSGIKDVKKQLPRKSKGNISSQWSKEDETQKFVESQGNSSGTVQKISLAPGVVAEDTLGNLRLMSNTSEQETRSRSPFESQGESIEESEFAFESSADFSLESGPSSPNLAVNTARCRECESLFNKMRRQPPPKTKNRDKHPASLSCDQWVLLKKWHPQRGRHREKGLLWTSLIQIRKLAVQASKNRTPSACSRPHVFQQRNLRRCKYLTFIQTDPSLTTAKPRHRKRQRPAVWPPIGGRKPVKRKSSMNNTLSQQLLSPKLSISDTQKNKPLLVEKFSVLNASTRQNLGASPKQKRKNVQDRFGKQEACDGIEGTRRVLKFDDTPEVVAVQTTKQSGGPRQQLESGKICEGQNGVKTKDLNGLQVGLFEDSDGFKTQTDMFTVKPKIKRGSQKKASAFGETKPAVQTANFMSMLATMVKNQNKIIKETCQ